MTNTQKILLVGGGTGGHMMPLLPLAAEAKKNNWEVGFLFSEGLVERKIYEQNFARFDVFFQSAQKVRRYLDWRNFLVPFQLIFSVIGTVKKIKTINPTVVFLKGSGVSFLVLIALQWINSAKKNKIKIFAHESDTSVSLSMKLCAQWADKVFASFGEPMQPLFYELRSERLEVRAESLEKKSELNEGATKYFSSDGVKKNLLKTDPKLDSGVQPNNKQNLLIFGGSQGALFLNQLVEQNFLALLALFNVVLVTGSEKSVEFRGENLEMRDASFELGSFQQFELLPAAEFDGVLQQADLVVCRSGASVFQVLAQQKKSLLIPYPYAARDHQLTNAQFFAERGLAYLVEEKNLREHPALFLTQIKKLASDEVIKSRLQQAHIKNSAEAIFDQIVSLSQ